LKQFLGLVLASEGEYDLADGALKEAVAIARKQGDLKKGSFSLAFHGDIALQQGDLSNAKKVYEESANTLRALGNKLFTAYPLRRLGYLALQRGEIQRARDYFRESLALNREGGDRRAVAACLLSFAALAIHMGKPALAARLLGAVESRLESLGINLLYLDLIEWGLVSNNLITGLEETTFTAAFAEGWDLSEDQAIQLVEGIFGGPD
jgi:tetratricopeptide (TPR) repeat protein